MQRDFLFSTQFLQNSCQDSIAFIELSNSSHNLVVSYFAACVSQLVSQIGQFLSMGGIVTSHILHQRQQLLQRSVGMFMIVVVVVMMLVTMLMEVLVIMGMCVIMAMGMVMLMAVSMAVMSMLVGVCVVMLTMMCAVLCVYMTVVVFVATSVAVMMATAMAVMFMFVHSKILLLFCNIFRIHKQIRHLNGYG